ncbi:hypothetical protein [Pantoea sp. YU22]|jgi:hypothetical protein|nr:hypothetical protein [Pantoea sp. YU22]
MRGKVSGEKRGCYFMSLNSSGAAHFIYKSKKGHKAFHYEYFITIK